MKNFQHATKSLSLMSILSLLIIFLAACSSTAPVEPTEEPNHEAIVVDSEDAFVEIDAIHHFRADEFPSDDNDITLASVNNFRRNIVNIARGELGVREWGSSNRNHRDGYMHARNGERYGPVRRAPWCSMFASWVWKKAGVTNFRSYPAVYDFYQWGKSRNRLKQNPEVGDALIWLVNPNRRSKGHIGIVVAVNGNRITTIEGNSGHRVRYRHYNLNRMPRIRGSFRGFVSPVSRSTAQPTPTPSTCHHPTIRKGNRGSHVRFAQRKLRNVGNAWRWGTPAYYIRTSGGADGHFGEGTRKAVIAFQKMHFPNDARQWDGIIGSNTWKKLGCN